MINKIKIIGQMVQNLIMLTFFIKFQFLFDL